MSTVSPVPDGHPSEIVGYVQPWIVNPGDEIDVKVSCTEPEYYYRVVRLIQGNEGPSCPPKQSEELTGPGLTGIVHGRYQAANPGSYAIVDHRLFKGIEKDVKQLRLSLYFQSHLPSAGHPQCLVSTLDCGTPAGFAVSLDEQGKVRLDVGTGKQLETFATDFQVPRHQWVKLDLTLEHQGNTILDFSLVPVAVLGVKPVVGSFRLQNHELADSIHAISPEPLLFAASRTKRLDSPSVETSNYFNGRIGHGGLSCLTADGTWHSVARYELSRGIETNTIFDSSGHSHHGTLINAPTRAVTDHEWTGVEVDWTKASCGYGAIHFHEDDLDDARWETDFRVRIPIDARSGAYAVRATSVNGVTSDDIVFFVRPSAMTAARVGAKTAVVLSTFTYLAYANERMYDMTTAAKLETPKEIVVRKDVTFERMERRKDVGLSLYDVHKDGTGVVFTSPRRPILNLRPDYVHWALHRPREFSADLMMIALLEKSNIPYDVLTDHDLHYSGLGEHGTLDMSNYDLLITGCHPEYPTWESLDAYGAFLKRGGSLMYMGGNGFYWAAGLQTPSTRELVGPFDGRLEVRRGDQGIRNFTLPGGERHLSVNGQRGTLWRSRGRPANHLVGVGSAGEGLGQGVPYLRTDASRDPKHAWIFEGIDADLIGVEGFGGGASGDEFDKYDVINGSPPGAAVLASSTGHSDDFGIFIEDAGFPLVNTLGTQTREIRSDMVLFETAGGGRVFSVGSINWYCSVGWDAFENDAARLTLNVVRGFLKNQAAES